MWGFFVFCISHLSFSTHPPLTNEPYFLPYFVSRPGGGEMVEYFEARLDLTTIPCYKAWITLLCITSEYKNCNGSR